MSGSVADGEYEEIASLDDPGEGDPLAAGSEEGTAQGRRTEREASADNPAVDNPGEAVLTGGTGVAEYIANVQLSREQIRAKNREALNALINNENLDASAKEAAVQDMLALNAIAEKENAAETLPMAKRICRSGCQHHGWKSGCRCQRAVHHRSAARADRGYCKTENRDIGGEYRDFL